MDKMISISEATKVLGVNTRTLKRWDNEGKLKVYRTLGNHRRYRLSEVEAFLGINSISQTNIKNAFIYVRVKKVLDKLEKERQVAK